MDQDTIVRQLHDNLKRFNFIVWVLYCVCWFILSIPGVIIISEPGKCSDLYLWLYIESSCVSVIILLINLGISAAEFTSPWILEIIILIGPWGITLFCVMLNILFISEPCLNHIIYPISLLVLTFLNIMYTSIS